MVSVSGPTSTGILAGRLSGSPGSRQNGDAESEKDHKAAERTRIRHESDLYVRPSWTDAAIALDQLEKVREENSYYYPRSIALFRVIDSSSLFLPMRINFDLGLTHFLSFSNS